MLGIGMWESRDLGYEPHTSICHQCGKEHSGCHDVCDICCVDARRLTNECLSLSSLTTSEIVGLEETRDEQEN